jgi:hypothetical protein
MLMKTMLFIHGSGVREEEYTKMFSAIAPRIRSLGYEPAPCLWGKDFGSNFNGAALPGSQSDSERETIALWRMLLQDPFAELRILETSPNAPGFGDHGETIWEKLTECGPNGKTLEILRRLCLFEFWPDASDELTSERDHRWERLVKRAAQNDGLFESALAQCLVAQLIRAAEANWVFPPSGCDRDELVQSIVTDLGGGARGIFGYTSRFAMSLFAPIATPIMRWTREAWSAGISPVVGDILMYQARGERIREFIKRRIEEQRGHVVVLAHSLGGIAAVDLLLSTDIPQVKALITVGSQCAYLYEIDGLTGLERGRSWPSRFPRRWLNIYDANDFLSYPGEAVFPGHVTDFRCCSNEPFPESHSAYWSQRETWTTMRSFLS